MLTWKVKGGRYPPEVNLLPWVRRKNSEVRGI
jgi:hypothetical protein